MIAGITKKLAAADVSTAAAASQVIFAGAEDTTVSDPVEHLFLKTLPNNYFKFMTHLHS